MMELKHNLEGIQDTLVPLIWKEEKSVEEFVDWRIEAITKINEMVKPITQDMDMTLFQQCSSKLVNSWGILWKF